jgi:hypothetical protein
MKDPSVKVILVSLKAGGVALNLKVTTRIFINGLWWEPAAEMQAIDCSHRFSQDKLGRLFQFHARQSWRARARSGDSRRGHALPLPGLSAAYAGARRSDNLV